MASLANAAARFSPAVVGGTVATPSVAEVTARAGGRGAAAGAGLLGVVDAAGWVAGVGVADVAGAGGALAAEFGAEGTGTGGAAAGATADPGAAGLGADIGDVAPLANGDVGAVGAALDSDAARSTSADIAIGSGLMERCVSR